MVGKCFFSLVLFCLLASQTLAKPYGPTLNEVAQKYATTRNFENLISNLNKEEIEIRLGMTKQDVESWAKRSTVYHIVSRKGSVYKFEPIGEFPTFHDLCFEVWLAKGVVVVIKTMNLNEFEGVDLKQDRLKPLKEVRVNPCWVRRNFVDPNSYLNGFDFALLSESNVPSEEEEACMGADRANITIGKPGLLYPKHVQEEIF